MCNHCHYPIPEKFHHPQIPVLASSQYERKISCNRNFDSEALWRRRGKHRERKFGLRA